MIRLIRAENNLGCAAIGIGPRPRYWLYADYFTSPYRGIFLSFSRYRVWLNLETRKINWRKY